MARLDLLGQVNSIPVRWSQLWTIERGYLVLFMFSDPVGSTSGAGAVQAMKSLHFTGKTN
jgi:hypothetical protein